MEALSSSSRTPSGWFINRPSCSSAAARQTVLLCPLYRVDTAQANLEIGEACLRYLMLDDFEQGLVRMEKLWNTEPVKAQHKRYVTHFSVMPPIIGSATSADRVNRCVQNSWASFLTQYPSPKWDAWTQVASAEGLRFISDYVPHNHAAPCCGILRSCHCGKATHRPGIQCPCS